MVNTRSKIKKTQTAVKACYSQGDSDHESTQSGAFVGSNDDLLTEILLLLPVISILRFKSVSKHWRRLLSHRNFTQRYDRLSESPGFFFEYTYVPYDVENCRTPLFRNLDLIPHLRIVQSCNGLLLCSNGSNRCTRDYFVFNPTTKQIAVIPPVSGGQNVQKHVRFMGLAFDQTDCVHYKVVCISRLVPIVDAFQIQIYSSDTRIWEISVKSFSSDCYFGIGVYLNGAIHWVQSNSTHYYFKFNVGQLQSLPLPVEKMSSEIFTRYFGESRGHLHLIVSSDFKPYNLTLNVYEMLSDYSGWFVKYQVDLHQLLTVFPEMISPYGYYEFDVIDVVRGEKEEDTFMVLSILRKLITYNVHDKSFKQIFKLTKDYVFRGYSSCHRYTKTLACV